MSASNFTKVHDLGAEWYCLKHEDGGMSLSGPSKIDGRQVSFDLTPEQVKKLSSFLSAVISTRRRKYLKDGDCKTCNNADHDPVQMFPYHDPSPMCKSGKHPHCTCDACF